MAKSNTPKAKSTTAQTANVETAAPAITSAPNVLNVDGLETAQAPITKHVADAKAANKFKDLEFLMTENPADYHVDENISPKYDKVREDKVYQGLGIIKTLTLSNGKPVNPLLILLAAWWEVKPARAGIKSLLDAEAEAKGYPSDVYLQVEAKKEIDELSEIQTAIDRIRYSTTYFKPRKALSNNVPMKQISIENKLYNVPIAALNEAKEQFGDDKEALKAHILSIAIASDATIEEL